MKNILLSIISIIVFFLFVEFLLFIIGYNPISFEDTFRLKVCGELLGEYDKDLFWRLKGVHPNFKGKNSLKVICLSDSVSVMYDGKGYPDILQENLGSSIPEKNPIVFNGGVPGYSSFQGLKYFIGELLPHNPDIVSVCYGWNDHWQSGNNVPDKLQQSPPEYIIKLCKMSRILALFRSVIFKVKQKQYSCVGPAEFFRVSLDDYRDNLQEFVDIAKINGIYLILMTAPYLNGPEDWIPTHKEYNAVVRKIAKKNNIPLIDLVERFKNRKNLFIDPEEDKCHYNWQASEVVALELKNKILNSIVRTHNLK